MYGDFKGSKICNFHCKLLVCEILAFENWKAVIKCNYSVFMN